GQTVTEVQTCPLPIYRQVAKIRGAAVPSATAPPNAASPPVTASATVIAPPVSLLSTTSHETLRDLVPPAGSPNPIAFYDNVPSRSEERRVGKEARRRS